MTASVMALINEAEAEAETMFVLDFDVGSEVWTLRCRIEVLDLYLKDKKWSTWAEAHKVLRVYKLRATNMILAKSGVVATLPITKVREVYEADDQRSLAETMYELVSDFQRRKHREKGGSHV